MSLHRLVAVAAALCFIAGAAVSFAEPGAVLNFDASPFAAKFKVTRYLIGGSGLEHKMGSFSTRDLCNGWRTDGSGRNFQTCRLIMNGPEDFTYTYRFRQVNLDGKQVGDILCTPLADRWECGTVER